MSKVKSLIVAVAFALGALTIVWVGAGFVGSSALALFITGLIATVYGMGALEIRQFRRSTHDLALALAGPAPKRSGLEAWLQALPVSLRAPVRMRLEGERVGLPAPSMAPYLAGLLVMLGMLGTFLGMVVTFKGAVFALEGSTDLSAIRSALAEPIRGLGLSFGTSVAGVAASAMLGLMSALSRRDRWEVSRLLDTCLATTWRPLTADHQHDESIQALQTQTRVLPELVDHLQHLIQGIERRTEQLHGQLQHQQADFHRSTSEAYAALASRVTQSLETSLSNSARAAHEGLKPIVDSTLAAIAKDSEHTHQRLLEVTQNQLTELSSRFGATARTVSEGWNAALQTQAAAHQSMVEGLNQSLETFTSRFDSHCNALLSQLERREAASLEQHTHTESQRLQAWSQAMDEVKAAWQTQSQQWAEQARKQIERNVDELARLLDQADAMVRAHRASESTWLQQHQARMDDVSRVWREELQALRQDESARGQAAVERLGELQALLTSQIGAVAQAIEAPMTRLLQSVSEVPSAATEAIAASRAALTGLQERDTDALERQTSLMARLNELVQAFDRSAQDQRAAIESLTASAQTLLDRATQTCSDVLMDHAQQASEATAQVTGSAVEISSLAEAFQHGVQVFSATSQQLTESLHRIDQALQQTLERSDQQLAYYVAQAREVIDLSITSQAGIIDDLRQLNRKPVAYAEEAA